MTQRFVNNFGTTLAATLGASDTFMGVASTEGLPSLGPGEFCLLTLYRGYGIEESGYEVVKVTAIAPKQLTVERAYEGAAPSLFLAGTRIEARNTARSMEAKMDKDLGDSIANSVSDLRSDIAKLRAATGDTITTVRSLPAPDWLLCDGSAYLKTSYPALYSVIGNLLALKDAPIISSISTVPSNIAVSGDGNWILIGLTSQAPSVRQRTGNTWTNTTFPNTMTADGGATINPDGTLFCVSSANTDETVFATRSGITLNRVYPTGYTFVSGDTRPKFSPDGTMFFLRKAATPYFSVHSVSGTVFTKLPDPAVAAGSSSVVDGCFSADNKYLAIAITNAPYVEVYKIEGSTLKKLAPLDIGGISAGAKCASVSLDATGSTLVASINYYPFALIYSRVGDEFSRMPELTPSLAGLVSELTSCSITQDGNHIIATTSVSDAPFGTKDVNLYKKIGNVFTRTTTTITMPTTAGARKHAMSTNGKLLLISGSFTGYAKAYEQSYDPVTQFGIPGIFVGAPTFIKT